MRGLITIFLMLTLSGCWTGDEFYKASESETAIPPGKYDIVYVSGTLTSGDISDFGKRLKISYDANGRAIIDNSEDGGTSEATLIKLGTAPGLYIVQADFGATIPKLGSSLYGLIQLVPGGYQIAVPRCDQKRAAIWDRAIITGLTVGKPVCKFSNRASFETAMLEYAKDPIKWTEYRRVVKKSKKPKYYEDRF
jgi:hypothetical protein